MNWEDYVRLQDAYNNSKIVTIKLLNGRCVTIVPNKLSIHVNTEPVSSSGGTVTGKDNSGNVQTLDFAGIESVIEANSGQG
jgi:hypothetical protein